MQNSNTQDQEKGYVLTLPTDRSVKVVKVFNYSKDLVWKAYTDKDLVAKWWGPREYDTIVHEMDFQVGGKWRFVHVDKEGKGDEYGFRGEYKEIDAPNKYVFTFEWEGLPGHILTETIELEEKDGKTVVTDVSEYMSKEDRDGMIASGMESGMKDSYDRLDELLADM